MDAIGIDMGNARWEVVHLKTSLSKARVAGSFTISEGAVHEKAERVRDYISGKRLGQCPLAVSIQDVALRVMEVPAGSDAALESAVGFEIERHLPCAPDEAAYCWMVTERKKGVFSVLIAVARKSVIEETEQVFREAGCGEVSVLPRAVALSAALRSHNESTVNACVVSGGERGHVDFFEGGFPYSSISVRNGRDLATAIETAVADRSRRKGRATESLLSCGSAEVPSPGIPVRTTEGGADTPRLVAYGAAESVLKDGRALFFRRRGSPRSGAGLGYAAAALLALSVISVPLKDHFDLWRVGRNVSALSGERESQKPGVARLKEMGGAVLALERVKGSTLVQLELLKALTEAAPAETHITSFESRATGEVAIEGLSRDASGFFLKLEGSGLVEGLEFTGPVTRSEGTERFRMRAKAVAYRNAKENR
ncbi:MAG: hypothetical protein HYV24_12905 [Deltaproteobacteria bacterium]|nr:hypothetical protein [Deltaproteobacteria bacterium]